MDSSLGSFLQKGEKIYKRVQAGGDFLEPGFARGDLTIFPSKSRKIGWVESPCKKGELVWMRIYG